MNVIHKFPAHSQEFQLNADVVHFGEQDEDLFVWAIPSNMERTYMYVGTDQPFESDWKHIQTCQDSYGFVWHLLVLETY